MYTTPRIFEYWPLPPFLTHLTKRGMVNWSNSSTSLSSIALNSGLISRAVYTHNNNNNKNNNKEVM